MRKARIRSRMDTILAGTGMMIAFSLILLKLLSLVETPDASSSEIVASYFQRHYVIIQCLCTTLQLDHLVLCR
ncbi:MAG TPA: hypothetical protein VNI77_02510 [Nitrososphaera sp.]|nr:hypothetical protein [Nitrososphaera sp.]